METEAWAAHLVSSQREMFSGNREALGHSFIQQAFLHYWAPTACQALLLAAKTAKEVS